MSGYAADAWVIVSVHRKPMAITNWLPPSAAAFDALGAVVGSLGRRFGGNDGATEFGDGAVEAGGGGVVERLVATSGDVEHQCHGRTVATCGSGAGWLAASRFRAGWLRCHRFGTSWFGPRGCGAGGLGTRWGGPGEWRRGRCPHRSHHRWTRSASPIRWSRLRCRAPQQNLRLAVACSWSYCLPLLGTTSL